MATMNHIMLTDNSVQQIESDLTLLDKLLVYIEENYAQRITLQDVAGHFFVSKSTISHTFSQALGISFYSYVTQCRLSAAETLILQGIPLCEINEKVGFADYPTFHRAFKQKHGISPRQFKKQLAEKHCTEQADNKLRN